MTKAEACLWKYALRASQMKGYGFRRQRPVLNYIADFMCQELFLIIEEDGITHQDEKVIENDKVRQSRLKAVSFTLLRLGLRSSEECERYQYQLHDFEFF